MGATIDRYRSPGVSQRGVDSTLDDCAVVATIVGLAHATLGEHVTTREGREMTRPQLQALARRLRRTLGPSEATGGLGNDDQVAMVRHAGYPAPRLLNLAFPEFKARLRARAAVYSIGGDPARIKGPSPLKRCDCAHEWAVAWDPDCGDDELIVYDGLRPSGPRQRGEVRPASEIRQMSFKDTDGDLAGVLEFPIGGWTREALTEDRLRDLLGNQRKKAKAAASEAAKTDERLRRRIAELEATTPPDCAALVANARAAAHESAHVTSIEWHEQQRSVGP